MSLASKYGPEDAPLTAQAALARLAAYDRAVRAAATTEPGGAPCAPAVLCAERLAALFAPRQLEVLVAPLRPIELHCECDGRGDSRS